MNRELELCYSRIMKKSLLILGFILLTGCGQANITYDCSINGNEKATCDFKNEGDAEGSLCLTAHAIRSHSEYSDYVYRFLDQNGYLGKYAIEQGHNIDGNLDWDDSIGSVISSESEICSGLIKPQDVRQTSKILSPFYTDWTDRQKNTLTNHCQLDTDDDYRTFSTGSWHDGCSMLFSLVTEE